jgi:hypothetical protein
VATTAVVHFLGVGGYRAGPFLATVAVAGTTGIVAVSCLRGVPAAGTWITTAIVLAVTAAVRVSVDAPHSKGRLTAVLDNVEPAFFEATTTRTEGHSWCRPKCPVVERIYRAPATGTDAAVDAVLVALAANGAVQRTDLQRATRTSGSARVNSEDYLVSVDAAPADRRLRVRVQLESRR